MGERDNCWITGSVTSRDWGTMEYCALSLRVPLGMFFLRFWGALLKGWVGKEKYKTVKKEDFCYKGPVYY